VIAAALLDKGADINVKDKDGETALLPLSKGMPMWWKSHSTEVDVQVRNQLGDTPLGGFCRGIAKLWRRYCLRVGMQQRLLC